MRVLSEGEIRGIMKNCVDMPTGYLIHSRVREVCETALHYMRQHDTAEKIANAEGYRPLCRENNSEGI